jgi:hypothetical protein
MDPEELERLRQQQALLGQEQPLPPVSTEGVDMTMTLPDFPVTATPLGQQPTQTQAEVPSVELLGQGAQAIATPTAADLAPTQEVQDIMPVPVTNVGLLGEPLQETFQPGLRQEGVVKPFGFIDTVKAAGSGVVQGLKDLVSDPQGTIQERVEQPITNVLAQGYNAVEGATEGSLPDRFRTFVDEFDPRQTDIARLGEFLTGKDISDPTVEPTAPAPTARVQELISQGLIDPTTGEATAAGTEQRTSQMSRTELAQENFQNRLSQGALSPQEIDAARKFATSQGQLFDPQSGYSPAQFYGQQYAGQNVNDMIAGRNTPGEATEQFLDPQGRLRRRSTTVDPITGQKALAPESGEKTEAGAAREARIASRPDFMEAVSDADRRVQATGGGAASMSDADRRKLAKGLMKGASVSEQADALKVQQQYGLGDFKPERTASEEAYLQKRTELVDAQIRNALDAEPTKTAGLLKEIEAINADRSSRGQPPLSEDERRMLLLQGIGGTVAATTIPEGSIGGFVGDDEIKEYGSVEEAEQAGLPKGTRITVRGKLGTIQ